MQLVWSAAEKKMLFRITFFRVHENILAMNSICTIYFSNPPPDHPPDTKPGTLPVIRCSLSRTKTRSGIRINVVRILYYPKVLTYKRAFYIHNVCEKKMQKNSRFL